MPRARTAVAAAVLILAAARPAQGQLEVSAGVLVADESTTTRVAPMLSFTLGGGALGVPLLLEAGFARTDFVSFGESFHRDYGAFVLGAEWTPVRAEVQASVRVGLGAVVEDDNSEDDPGFTSSANWAGGLVVGLLLRGRRGSGREVFLHVSDHVLGVRDALFDPDEYDLAHRIRVLVGVRMR